MITIKNFGLYPMQKQEEFFNILISKKKHIVSYYVPIKPTDADEDTIDLYLNGLIQTNNSCMDALIKSCLMYNSFIYSVENNKYMPELILNEMEKNLEYLENGGFKLIDKKLQMQISKSMGLCFFADIDLKKIEDIKKKKFCKNHICYYNKELHYNEYEVIWYYYENAYEIISELHKHGRFEFLLVENNIEEYLLGFEIYENAESFDLFINTNEKDEIYQKKFKKFGFTCYIS